MDIEAQHTRGLPGAGERTGWLDALNEREARVLAAIVEAHILHNEPVASRTLAARDDLHCSPATIRNVMAALHGRGLIAKPHTSAGRVPTTLGLRVFVDCLLQVQEPPPTVQEEIAAQLAETGTVERALDEAGRVLSRLSQKACIVSAPRTDWVRLRQIDFLRLRDDALLVLLVTSEGLVQNRLVELDPRTSFMGEGRLPPQEELSRIGRYLSGRIPGLSLAETRALLERERDDAASALDAWQQRAHELGALAVRAERREPPALRIEGERHLIDAQDPRSVARLPELLSALEEKSRIVTLLERAQDAPGVRLFIGEENPLRELADMTLITASYGNGSRILGTLGVIGPTRMDYARVVPLVELTAQLVSRLLT